MRPFSPALALTLLCAGLPAPAQSGRNQSGENQSGANQSTQDHRPNPAAANPSASSQAAPGQPDTYAFRMSVDEVVLTFHASDAHGLAVTGLLATDLRLLDNGQPPARILAFESRQDLPIRAAFLFDTSSSMHPDLARNQGIAAAYARQLLRQSSDQALVTEFGYASNLALPWTSDPESLARAIRNIREGKMNPLGGTALYDTVFRTCFYPYGKTGIASSANFILLFSDGEDNASHTTLEEAVRTCQQTNTAIYAFAPLRPAITPPAPRPRRVAKTAASSPSPLPKPKPPPTSTSSKPNPASNTGSSTVPPRSATTAPSIA